MNMLCRVTSGPAHWPTLSTLESHMPNPTEAATTHRTKRAAHSAVSGRIMCCFFPSCLHTQHNICSKKWCELVNHAICYMVPFSVSRVLTEEISYYTEMLTKIMSKWRYFKSEKCGRAEKKFLKWNSCMIIHFSMMRLRIINVLWSQPSAIRG